MKTTKNFISVLLFATVFTAGSATTASAQFSVFRANGTGCTGSPNIFVFTGSNCSSLWWTVYGGGTIVSGQNTSSVTVRWDSPTSNAMVSVGYSCSNWDGSIVSNTAYSPAYEMSNAVTPSVGITSNITEVCQGTGSITFTALPANGGSSPYYNWYIDGGHVSSGTSSQLTYNTGSLGSGSHTAYVVMSSNAACVSTSTATSSNGNFNVNARGSYSVNINGPGTICSNNTTVAFYATVSGTYGNPTYQWYKNSAPVATGNPFTTAVNQNDAIYCVVSSDGCVDTPVTSATYNVNITGAITPTVSIQIPKLNYCSGETIAFTAASTYGGTSYSWKLNGSQFSTSTSTSLPVTTDGSTVNAFSPGDIVTLDVSGLSGSCLSGTSATATTSGIPITINPVVTPYVTLTAPDVCLPGNVNLTATPAYGGVFPTYTFYIDGAQVSSGTSNTYSGSITAGSHSAYVVMNSTESCPAVATATSLTENFTAANKASYSVLNNGPGVICSNNSTVGFYATVANGVGNLTYQWFKNTAPVFTGNPFNTTVSEGDAIYCMVSSDHWCVNSPQPSGTYNVDITPAVDPAVSIQVPKLNFCSGEIISFSVSSPYGGSSYSWKLNGNPFSTASSASLPVSSNINAPDAFSPGDVVTVDVGGLSGSCLTSTSATGTTASIPFQINPMVTPQVSLSPASSLICSGTTQQITAAPSNGGDFPTYAWHVDGAPVAGSGNTYVTSTSLSPGPHSIYVVMNSTAPCPTQLSDTSDPVTVVINSVPQANAGSDITLIMPANSTTLLADVSDPDGTTPAVLWTKVSGGNAVLSDPTLITLSLNELQGGEYTFRVTATDQCTSSTDDVIVIVDEPLNNYNWIKETLVFAKNQKTETDVAALQIQEGEKSLSWTYFDGLGRPIQNVSVQGSPGKRDIVQPIVYDEFGREEIKYLPYVSSGSDGWFKVNAVGQPGNYNDSDHQSFYSNGTDKVEDDLMPYVKTVFEPSPLNRIVKQGSPGEVWQPSDDPLVDRSVRKKYEANNDLEVFFFQYDPSTVSIIFSEVEAERYYSADMLYKNKTSDEHSNEVIEYMDKEGRIVCKKVQYDKVNGVIQYASTYYIYDDFGNLVVVLPPEAVKEILAN